MVLVEDRLLDLVHNVTVLADDLGQGDLPDFSQLCFREPDRRLRILVPKPVALLDLLKLDSNNAGEGRPHERTLQGHLRQTTREQVDVFD